MLFHGRATNQMTQTEYECYITDDAARHFHQWWFDENFKPEPHMLEGIVTMSHSLMDTSTENTLIPVTWSRSNIILEKSWRSERKLYARPDDLKLQRGITLESHTSPVCEFGGYTAEGAPTVRDNTNVVSADMVAKTPLTVLRVDAGLSLVMAMAQSTSPSRPVTRSTSKSESSSGSRSSPAKSSPTKPKASPRTKTKRIPPGQLLIGKSALKTLQLEKQQPRNLLPFAVANPTVSTYSPTEAMRNATLGGASSSISLDGGWGALGGGAIRVIPDSSLRGAASLRSCFQASSGYDTTLVQPVLASELPTPPAIPSRSYGDFSRDGIPTVVSQILPDMNPGPSGTSEDVTYVDMHDSGDSASIASSQQDPLYDTISEASSIASASAYQPVEVDMSEPPRLPPRPSRKGAGGQGGH